MEKIVLIVHMLVAFGIIGLILMQQGKGAEAGASFGGGASQTVFGSSGSGNFFSRTTAILATIFFATSFGLAMLSKQSADINIDEGLPSVIEQPAVSLPASNGSDLPSVEQGNQTTPTGDLPSVVEEAEVVIPNTVEPKPE